MFVLKASVSLTASATSLLVYDKTGIGVTGWSNGSNPAVGDATSAVVRVYLPDATTLLPQTTYTEIDAFPTLPNISNTPFEITAEDLGYTSGTIPDGWFMFDYIVVANGTTYEAPTVQKVFTYNACCCKEQAEAAANFDCGCNDNSSLWKSLKLAAMMNTLKKLAGCYKPRKAVDLLLEMQRTCDGNDCVDC